jgi:pSer/pThr/pTyr-binding forkhead associated (FHA) protein
VNGRVICRTGFAAGLTKSCGDKTRIGRDEANEISIPHEGLSRLHATISYSGGTYWIEDGGSTNGTFLNGHRIKKERLKAFDVISLGRGVDLIFLMAEVSDLSAALRRGIVNAKMVALDGPEPGAARVIPKGTITIGRTSACNVQLEGKAISKIHARIERTSDRLVVSDLGSSNGTFVNGAPIETAVLGNGDTLSFANFRQFRVELEHGMVLSGGSSILLPRTREPEGEEQKTRMQLITDSVSWRLLYDFSPDDVEDPREKSARVAPAVAPSTRSLPIEAVALIGDPPLRAAHGAHVVGRDLTCELVVPDGTVSRRHARLDVTAHRVVLTDLGSGNGTFVNGERLQAQAPRELSGGETVDFGHRSFRVELVRAAGV